MFCKKAAICLLLTASLTLCADSIRFRSGVLLGAELSRRPVSIALNNPDAFPDKPQKTIYAVLTLKLDQMRSISIFDYSLDAFGSISPCIAITRNKRFEYFTERYATSQPIQLLFIVDGAQVGLAKRENIKLKCNFPPSDGTFDTIVEFKMLDNSPVTPLSRVPAAGMFPAGGKTK